MKFLFKKQSLCAAAIAGLVMLGAQVQASSLSIVVPSLKDNDFHKEVVGDSGGSSYPNNPGIPTVLGGWPTSPIPNGFAPDPSFGNVPGYFRVSWQLPEIKFSADSHVSVFG